jgi:hypothetical protein
LAPTVGIAATGFCYPGGILRLFHRRYQQIFSTSSRSTTRTAEDSWSKDTEQYEEIKINKFCGCEQQPDGSINLQQASTRSIIFSAADSSQIASTDPGRIRHDHHQQGPHQQLECGGASRFVTILVFHRQPAARAARIFSVPIRKLN